MAKEQQVKKVNITAVLHGKGGAIHLSPDEQSNPLKLAMALLEEKLSRDLGITVTELRERFVKLGNGEITVEEAYKKKEIE